ncbi:RNA exonuclease 4-like protein [Cinnamomum micranthum f. kanehirae]|uniref:RNA exonuclease 4-like protein n=1 Tax=Cinnamomum micranthum f. kanehirae TaxID=337451 RepID=A0A3S3QJX0_9MAGN|nr:RNA exonuclease 4-like protein [Cinnamomum micranthum f. kanehirae]
MDFRAESSESVRNVCAACFRQFNKLEHLVDHMRTSFHSVHEPMCGICKKHCRSFESLREHLIGPLPKVECARIFGVRGCNLCLTVLDSPNALRIHRGTCQFARTNVGLVAQMARLNMNIPTENEMYHNRRTQGPQVVALACKMVGGGNDGSLDLCAKVCLVDEDENIIFQTNVKPKIPVTNYRYETTGIRPDHLRDAMPLNLVQRRIQDILCNGELLWKIRTKGGKARILVGHGLDHDLDCLGVEYPAHLIRYDIQTGIQEPYEECVASMRLYMRMRSQAHQTKELPGSSEAQHLNNFASWRQKELEKMTPEALLEISRSKYYCWCLDSKQRASKCNPIFFA